MVEHFIKPLTVQHLASNSDIINRINNQILSDESTNSTGWNNDIGQNNTERSFQCNFCKARLDPTASNVKDQTLTCGKCNHLFHKKCTDRKNSRSNWRKQPWFCQQCILRTPLENTETPTSRLNPSANSFQPAGMFSHNSISVDEPGSVSISNSSSNSRRILTTISNGPHNHLQPLGSQSVSFEPSANSGPTNADTLGAFHPNGTTSHNQRFPTTATRQRSSNVNTIDAELEFHKTALNTCRSNIAQQEVELKRLKESIEIRNKRIMNLEAQVGHASDLFANRNINDSSSDGLNSNICLKIDQLL